MLKKLLIAVAILFSLNLLANEEISPVDQCESVYSECTDKCEKISEDAQENCYEKCDLAYGKCLEEAQSK